MRAVIITLTTLMFLLMLNLGVYVVSEDYRFFLKKLKYQGEVVYDEEIIVDDTERIALQKDETGEIESYEVIEDLTFLEALSRKGPQESTDESIQEELVLTFAEQEVLDLLGESYILSEKSYKDTLFTLTDQYPDQYREYSNKHINFYIFPTKKYEDVKDIFEVLSYELPYTLNEVNNFGSQSLYINLDPGYEDDSVRLIFEYKKRAFGLKIQKDNYNTIKTLLISLK